MSLKTQIPDKQKVGFCNELLDEIEKHGLGSMLKSDSDALMYYLISKYIEPGIIEDRHKWIEILRVKPSKLNSIQELASVKFNDLNDAAVNWTLVAKQFHNHSPEVEDQDAGTVVVYIDDAHIYRFLEKYLNDIGSSPKYVNNKTQLVLKYQGYLSILEELNKTVELDIKLLKKELANDKSAKKIENTYSDIGAILIDIKEQVKDATISEVTTNLLKFAGSMIFKYAKKQIGSK